MIRFEAFVLKSAHLALSALLILAVYGGLALFVGGSAQ
jgi:hypothetical protein